jgi:hypothetical protein
MYSLNWSGPYPIQIELEGIELSTGFFFKQVLHTNPNEYVSIVGTVEFGGDGDYYLSKTSDIELWSRPLKRDK